MATTGKAAYMPGSVRSMPVDGGHASLIFKVLLKQPTRRVVEGARTSFAWGFLLESAAWSSLTGHVVMTHLGVPGDVVRHLFLSNVDSFTRDRAFLTGSAWP